jgi:hypothetical protein
MYFTHFYKQRRCSYRTTLILGVHGRIILRHILQKSGGQLATGFKWLRTGSSGGRVLVNTVFDIPVNIKDRDLLAGQLSASGGHSSMKLRTFPQPLQSRANPATLPSLCNRLDSSYFACYQCVQRANILIYGSCKHDVSRSGTQCRVVGWLVTHGKDTEARGHDLIWGTVQQLRKTTENLRHNSWSRARWPRWAWRWPST